MLSCAAAVQSLPVRAQQKPTPVIGYLHARSRDEAAAFAAAFRQGLADSGYVEGQNVQIEYRWAEGRYDQSPRLAADLASRNVAAIVAVGPSSAHAAKNATSTIPIVFLSGDPVLENLVDSLARPGGNLTGFSVLAVDLAPKQLELLSELAPQAGLVALLVNPDNAYSDLVSRDVQQAAARKRLQLVLLRATTNSEIDAAFDSLVGLNGSALVITADPFFNTRSAQLIALASRHGVATIFAWRDFAASGGLISYGPSLMSINRQAGVYAGKILNGAKPADLPVQQPTKFELVINLKTAKALGLTVPPVLLAQADEVIE
jgi:putative ABC transport system substrate-binding protein